MDEQAAEDTTGAEGAAASSNCVVTERWVDRVAVVSVSGVVDMLTSPQLETAIDTRLFNRTTRSVSLTEAGTLYLQQVGPALENIRAALGEVRSRHAEPAGVLRINAFASAARSALLPLMLDFMQRYPKVHIDLVTEGRLVDKAKN